MNPRLQNVLRGLVLIAVLAALIGFFPRAYVFVEMAARELRYFWWLMLIVALAVWLIWGLGGKPKR